MQSSRRNATATDLRTFAKNVWLYSTGRYMRFLVAEQDIAVADRLWSLR